MFDAMARMLRLDYQSITLGKALKKKTKLMNKNQE